MSELPPCFIVETGLSYNSDENSVYQNYWVTKSHSIAKFTSEMF